MKLCICKVYKSVNYITYTILAIEMYSILKSHNIESRYCVISAKDGSSNEYSINYLCENHKEKQNTKVTLTDRYIYLEETSKLCVVTFDNYNMMHIFLAHLQRVLPVKKISGNISFHGDIYKSKALNEKYKLDKNSIVECIKKIFTNDPYVKTTPKLEHYLAYGTIFNKLLSCPVDYSSIANSLQLYFRYREECSITATMFPPGVSYIVRGPVVISTGQHVEHIVSSDNQIVDISVLKRASPSQSQEELGNLNVDKATAFVREGMETLAIRPQNCERDVDSNEKSLEPVQPKKRIAPNKNSCVQLKCKYKFYKGHNSAEDSDEFINEIKKILFSELPIKYLDEYDSWFYLSAMCSTIGKKYDNIEEMQEIFDLASQRSSKYNKENNNNIWGNESIKYTIEVKYLYNLLLENSMFTLVRNENMLDEEIEVLLALYTFKYVKCIKKLIYRKETGHYYECDDDVLKRLFFTLYKSSITSMKTYIQNMIYNIESRVEVIDIKVYEFKDIIPFRDGLFDLNARSFRLYTESDYILHDVGYNFPRSRYSECMSNYDKFLKSSECLKHVSELFLRKNEENMFWQAMSENLNRRCRYDSIIIFFGSKSNGKGSIFSLNSSAFGELDVSVGTKYLEQRKSTGGEPEFYNLLYSMFASVPDFTNPTMCSDRLKMTSTGDKMTFRMLYSNDYISFVPSFTTVIGCNTLPRFTLYDGGIRRRLVIIPFRVSFSPNPRKGEIFKLVNPSIRENFRTNESWRNDYMVNLIYTYYLKRIEYNCSEHLRLIDSLNNRFLSFLFSIYKISDSSNETYSLDSLITEYKGYLIENNALRTPVCKERVQEVLILFDIHYDPITNMISGIERI